MSGGLLPDWDGASMGGRLPGWAMVLGRDTGGRYTFTTMRVHDGRAVVAILTGDGGGPLLVVCRDEDEMRHALGLEPRTPRS